MDSSPTIIYEQPLNEIIRICLRLEDLFVQFKENAQSETRWQTRTAIDALLKIVNIVDRPDLKPKLTQTLSQHATSLAMLESVPQVDMSRLGSILHKLDTLIDALHNFHGKFGVTLRQNEFLNHVRAHLGNPAGATDQAIPEFALWLQQPMPQRAQQLQGWFQEFDLLKRIVDTHLHLTRLSASEQTLHTTEGFYQQALDPNLPCQLLRIKLPVSANVYPESSVGKHRLVIRFLKMVDFIQGTQQQYMQPLEFQLTCCRI